MLSGRALLDLITGALEARIGFIADIVDSSVILESLLEEYFYGGSFQDQFNEQLLNYSIPSDVIAHIRREIVISIGRQISCALGGISPAYQYSFRLLPSGDVLVTETPPLRRYRSLKGVG